MAAAAAAAVAAAVAAAAAASEGCENIVVISSSRWLSPLKVWYFCIIEAMMRMACDPELGWNVKRSKPEISLKYRSILCIICSAPWIVS